jgi:hypothetical protein
MTTTKDSLQKLLYQLSETATVYSLAITTAKTKTLALTGKYLIRAKLLIISQ